MYARLITFTLKSGMRSAAEQLAEQFSATIKAMDGYQSMTFFIDETNDEYGAFSLWSTKEDAEAVSAVTGPRLQEALSEIGTGPPTVKTFEVYEPKG